MRSSVVLPQRGSPSTSRCWSRPPSSRPARRHGVLAQPDRHRRSGSSSSVGQVGAPEPGVGQQPDRRRRRAGPAGAAPAAAAARIASATSAGTTGPAGRQRDLGEQLVVGQHPAGLVGRGESRPACGRPSSPPGRSGAARSGCRRAAGAAIRSSFHRVSASDHVDAEAAAGAAGASANGSSRSRSRSAARRTPSTSRTTSAAASSGIRPAACSARSMASESMPCSAKTRSRGGQHAVQLLQQPAQPVAAGRGWRRRRRAGSPRCRAARRR